MRSHALRPAALHAGPNMTPLVDVVMVILIFLMLAGSFGTAEHVLVGQPPGVPAATGPVAVLGSTRQLEVCVERTSHGVDAMRLSGAAVANPDALVRQLTERRSEFAAAGGAADVQVVIRPVGDAPWAAVLVAYDAAVRAGFTKVGFAPEK